MAEAVADGSAFQKRQQSRDKAQEKLAPRSSSLNMALEQSGRNLAQAWERAVREKPKQLSPDQKAHELQAVRSRLSQIIGRVTSKTR